jgi:hypothetical protein
MQLYKFLLYQKELLLYNFDKSATGKTNANLIAIDEIILFSNNKTLKCLDKMEEYRRKEGEIMM